MFDQDHDSKRAWFQDFELAALYAIFVWQKAHCPVDMGAFKAEFQSRIGVNALNQAAIPIYSIVWPIWQLSALPQA